MKTTARTSSTPVVIRGESQNAEFKIDTLSFSFPASVVLSKIGCSSTSEAFPSDVALEVFEVFPLLKALKAERMGGFKNNFAHHCAFADQTGFIAFGGNNKVYLPAGVEYRAERIQVYITGAGCEKLYTVNPGWLSQLHDKLTQIDEAKITRIDVAGDFYNGEYDVQTALGMYEQGAFTSSGRPPKASLIDDLGSDNGKTFYVGNRANGKLLRVYEKGKQLGDKSSKWVRWELELSNKDRVVPFDILLNPKSYLAGSYPAMSFIHSVVSIVKTVKQKAVITLKSLQHYARQSYGALLNYMLKQGETAESIVQTLIKNTYPRRLAIY